jgi:anti-anti-sigma factor
MSTAQQRDTAPSTESFEPAGLIVSPHGELDITSAPQLRTWMREAVEAGTQRLVVDLSSVTFIDSVALAAILHVSRQLEPGRLAVVSAPDSYAALIIDVAGLRHCVACVETTAEAVEHTRSLTTT